MCVCTVGQVAIAMAISQTQESVISPDCLLVVHESLVELALHLENAGQVGVGSCKLRVDLRGREKGVSKF